MKNSTFNFLNKKKYQALKDKTFPTLNRFTQNLTINKYTQPLNYVHSKQGYSGRIFMEQIYKKRKKNFKESFAYKYFYNVINSGNYTYFDMFNKLSKELNIKVIYMITPKSKQYHLDLQIGNYFSLWENILNTLKNKQIEIWDYENMNVSSFEFEFYRDQVHHTTNAAKAFSKTIKKRLRNEN